MKRINPFESMTTVQFRDYLINNLKHDPNFQERFGNANLNDLTVSKDLASNGIVFAVFFPDTFVVEGEFSPAHSEQAEGRFNRQTNWRTEKNK